MNKLSTRYDTYTLWVLYYGKGKCKEGRDEMRYLGFTHGDHDGVGAAIDGALDHEGFAADGTDDGGGAGGGEGADGLVHFAVVDVAVFAVDHYGLWGISRDG